MFVPTCLSSHFQEIVVYVCVTVRNTISILLYYFFNVYIIVDLVLHVKHGVLNLVSEIQHYRNDCY